MKKYSILVCRTEKPFDHFVLYRISLKDAKMKFYGFDRNLYECELTFTSKKRREIIADFLANKGFKFVYPECQFDLFLQKSKGGNV